MGVIYLDCFAGISGNMMLGALIDIGVPEEYLRTELAKLPVNGYEMTIRRVSKQGVDAVYVDVEITKRQPHRHFHDIVKIIDDSTLADAVKADSKRIFRLLAEAEAKVHGTTPEKIHFHEVGAVDAIVDIVGTVSGLRFLGVEKLYASKLHVGSGFVKCCHGWMPVPAPATAELLRDIPYYSKDIARELVTPTGAAIVAALGAGFGTMPAGFASRKIGYGAGTWDLDIPNVLRMHLGEIAAQTDGELLVVETNLDDMNPQNYSYVMERLFNAGALDVWLTPVIMKKGRPGTQLSILIGYEGLDKAADIIMTETTSIGIRYYPVTRRIAGREWLNVQLPWGQVRVKVCRYGGKILNVMPEYEDCRLLAEQAGVPLKVIQQAAGAEALKFFK